MNDLITLTDQAANHIAQILKRHKNGIGLRLSVKKTGCSGYQYSPSIVDWKKESDINVNTPQGVTIFIDPQWIAILQGIEIDLIEEKLGQRKLVYKNPNVEDECGCGDSFNLKKNHEEK